MQKLKSERHNLFTGEISKIVLSSSNDKRMQSIDSMEAYAYGTNKDVVSEKEKIKGNKTTQKLLALIMLQNKT